MVPQNGSIWAENPKDHLLLLENIYNRIFFWQDKVQQYSLIWVRRFPVIFTSRVARQKMVCQPDGRELPYTVVAPHDVDLLHECPWGGTWQCSCDKWCKSLKKSILSLQQNVTSRQLLQSSGPPSPSNSPFPLLLQPYIFHLLPHIYEGTFWPHSVHPAAWRRDQQCQHTTHYFCIFSFQLLNEKSSLAT